jgi:hypothetical protein
VCMTPHNSVHISVTGFTRIMQFLACSLTKFNQLK